MGLKLRADGALIAIYAKIIKVARCSGAVGEKSGKLAGKVRADGKLLRFMHRKGNGLSATRLAALLKMIKALRIIALNLKRHKIYRQILHFVVI